MLEEEEADPSLGQPFPAEFFPELSSSSQAGATSRQLRALARAGVMEILRNRGERRKAVRLRDQMEQRRIRAKWRFEETQAREERFRHLFNRLSQTRSFARESSAAKLAHEIKSKMERAQQRAEEERKRRATGEGDLAAQQKEHLDRYNAEYERQLQKRKEENAAKLKLAAETLAKAKKEQELKRRLIREHREKQTLRSKIHTTLTVKARNVCDRYWKDNQRLADIDAKEAAKLAKNKSSATLPPTHTGGPSQPGLQSDDPQKVLLNYLSQGEIEQVCS